MSQQNTLIQAIIERTLTVPRIGMVTEDDAVVSSQVSRQLDIALISAGFKASAELLEFVSKLTKADATALATETINSVKHLVGDHVKHNVYFKQFPEGVPDTIEFWTELIERTFGEDGAHFWSGNLLELDGYGKYQHSYEEMVREHKPLVEKLNRTLKEVKLGGTLQVEVNKLFISLAESNVPLNEADRDLLGRLAAVADKNPSSIPVRENKAIINSVYITEHKPLLIDTLADVLRLAAHLSGGDVTLQEKTKYKNFNNTQRKALVKALRNIEDKKLADVLSYREQTKRLITHLHGAKDPRVRNLLDIANGKVTMSTYAGKIEEAFNKNDVQLALIELDKFPGRLLRNLNRLLMASRLKDFENINKSLEKALETSSLRVILSLRQYIENRNIEKIGRAFVNKKGGTYVLQEALPKLPGTVLNDLRIIIDREVEKRMADTQIVVDESVRHYALPISDKQRASGLNVVPRGTMTGLDPDAEILRFFIYWKEKSHADYDLSLIMLDENFQQLGQVSYTNLRDGSVVHSGDITSAPRGASEFIDVELKKMDAKYLVPQVNVYSGDTFDEAKEAFFGFMLRSKEEKGLPFEAKTVKTKSDLYGSEKIALPMVFVQGEDGWYVKQLNLFLKGLPRFNATETNASQTQVLMQSVVFDDYLTMEYLESKVKLKEPEIVTDSEGVERKVEVPVKTITHTNIHEIIVE